MRASVHIDDKEGHPLCGIDGDGYVFTPVRGKPLPETVRGDKARLAVCQACREAHAAIDPGPPSYQVAVVEIPRLIRELEDVLWDQAARFHHDNSSLGFSLEDQARHLQSFTMILQARYLERCEEFFRPAKLADLDAYRARRAKQDKSARAQKEVT